MTKTQIPAPEEEAQAYDRVFDNMYVTNVEKRLRELNSPSVNDMKRWVWELIQNAKDTIAKDPNRNSIDVRIEVDGDCVRFRHNGAPFTADALFGLLYKYSEDKEGQESTGRFGTGFLTTHCLSKVVSIESNMITKDGLRGFSVTMYRDGLIKSDLIEGLQKMKDSKTFYSEIFKWTTFTYHISSESGRQAIKLGIENFHENIAQTMLFCKELSSVVLDYNGKKTTIERKPTRAMSEDIFMSEFVISDDSSLIRRFIHTSYSEYNEELTKRYQAKRNMRIDTAVEVDLDNNLVDLEGKTSFFCVLPLVGIETQLNEPLIINSPDFEPDQERQSLLLSGNTWNEEKDVITENGINRAIYEHIFPMYQRLVSFLANEHYGKLYCLANGLDRPKSHEKLDKDWYKQNVINKYREVLMQFPIAEAQDGSGYRKLEECIIAKEQVKENEVKLYNLLRSLYPSKLIKDNHEWSDYLWKDGLAVWNTEMLCSDVEKVTNWNNLNVDGTLLPVWYNDFLEHVLKYNELLFKEYSLLPNMYGDLLKKDKEGFKQGEHINSFIIELIGQLGKDVKPDLLHEDITAVSLDSKYNTQSYSAEINRLAKSIIENVNVSDKINQLLPIISVVPDDAEKYNKDFLNQRKEFFGICKALYQLNEVESKCDNNLLESAWKDTDAWFVNSVLSSLNSLGSIEALPDGLDAKWLNSALKSLDVQTDRLNKYAVLPNQDGYFCFQNSLFVDAGIPEELKDNIFGTININYKDILLHKDIDADDFAVVQKKTISSFASELNDAISAMPDYKLGNPFYGYYHKFSKETIDNVSLYMISLLPHNKESELYKFQSLLLSIVQAFKISEGPTGDIDFENESLWEKVGFYAACLIWKKIEDFSTLNDLCEDLNKSETDVIGLLNSYYAYQDYAKITYKEDRVIPNQNGEFLSMNDLYSEEGVIDESLKNIINDLSQVDSVVSDFRSQLMDKRINIKLDRVLNAKDAYDMIDESIDRLYQIPTKWEDPNYIKASQTLIEDWGDKHKGVFEDSFPRVFPNKEKILMNVVWKKEKRELMMTVSSKLTEDQLKIIIQNSSEIGELSSKVQSLEEENERLRLQLESMGLPSDGDIINPIEVDAVTDDGKHITITVAEPQYAGLSVEEMHDYLKQAKTDVMLYLKKKGYRFERGICEDAWCNIYGVYSPEGKEVPMVVHSYKSSQRAFSLNAFDWEQLSKEGSMLWVVTHNGPQCVPFYALPRDTSTIAITFSAENMQDKSRCFALAETLRYFKGLHFNFGTAIAQNKSPEPFNNPKKELEQSLKNTMLDLYDLPAQNAPASLTTDSQESLL